MYVVLHTTCMYHHCVCVCGGAVGGSSVDLYIHKWRPTNTAVTDVISCNLNTTQRTEWIRSSSRRKDSIPATLNKSDVLKKPTVHWNVEAHLSGKAATYMSNPTMSDGYVCVCVSCFSVHSLLSNLKRSSQRKVQLWKANNEWMNEINSAEVIYLFPQC